MTRTLDELDAVYVTDYSSFAQLSTYLSVIKSSVSQLCEILNNESENPLVNLQDSTRQIIFQLPPSAICG